ncbi:soluble NSF attachment family protein [Candidatus Woesearchaeota archaeon]|nr:soluble NSF attachment family protein [Candidatus Woesearchaeota archaeon]
MKIYKTESGSEYSLEGKLLVKNKEIIKIDDEEISYIGIIGLEDVQWSGTRVNEWRHPSWDNIENMLPAFILGASFKKWEREFDYDGDLATFVQSLDRCSKIPANLMTSKVLYAINSWSQENYKGPSKEELRNQKYHQAWSLRRQGKFQEAIELFIKTDYIAVAAETAFEANMFEEAIELSDKAIERTMTVKRKIEIAKSVGRENDAYLIYLDALDRKNKASKAFLEDLADIAVTMKDYQTAISIREQLGQLMQASTIAFEAKKSGEAKRLAKLIYEKYPNDYDKCIQAARHAGDILAIREFVKKRKESKK